MVLGEKVNCCGNQRCSSQKHVLSFTVSQTFNWILLSKVSWKLTSGGFFSLFCLDGMSVTSWLDSMTCCQMKHSDSTLVQKHAWGKAHQLRVIIANFTVKYPSLIKYSFCQWLLNAASSCNETMRKLWATDAPMKTP